MSRAIVCELEGDDVVLSGLVRGACLECGSDVAYLRTAPEGTSVPIFCGECGFEFEMRRLSDSTAAIRRPYGCRRFVRLDSSNLDAAGHRDGYLLIRFLKGGVYRYVKAASKFSELISAPSCGKFFHREIKKAFSGDRLCATYGHFEPANGQQLQCEMCRGVPQPDRPVE